MNYEEKYKEALERAKAMIKVADKQEEVYGAAITIFPELAESEDEKTRKKICKLLWDNATYEEAQEYIAWLEKQGKVNDYSLTMENEKIRKAILELVRQSSEVLDKQNQESMIAWLEKQGEKLPVGFYYVNSEGKKFYSDTLKCGDITVHVEKQGEQKETPCDRCRKEQPSHSCQDITELGRCALEHEQQPADKKELKQLSQSKVTKISEQVWSKEDEEMLNDAIGAISAADYYTYDDKQEIENWLKSLKDRICCELL